MKRTSPHKIRDAEFTVESGFGDEICCLVLDLTMIVFQLRHKQQQMRFNSLIVIFACITVAYATIGVDVATPVSQSAFQCMVSKNYSFAIIRVRAQLLSYTHI
jgi:hypothetical protein